MPHAFVWLGLLTAAAAVATWRARHYALRGNLLDQPGERRSHSVATPRGGGIAIVAVVLAFMGLKFSGGALDTSRIAAIQTPEDAADVLDELIDRYGDPPPSVSDLVNVSLVRVQAAAVGVYEVTQKKDTLLLQVETLDVAMIRGLLIAFNGRVTAGAGTKPYLSVTLQPDEKPLELLQSILKAMADILAAPPEENTGKK